jgi:cyclic pyranopterin phosphate synthase
MPEQGICSKPHAEILRFEEILRLVQCAAELGINKIRVTGGEPLVRRGVVDFIGQLAKVPGIKEVSMTTNGTLLKDFASQLKENGLARVNISLDTLNKQKFMNLTRWGRLEDVWAGIEAALEVGLMPVKLNTVVMKGFNDDQIIDFVKLTMRKPLHVRFIELMPIGESDGWWQEAFLSVRHVLRLIQKHYSLKPIVGLAGSGPAFSYQVPGSQGSIGFISAISDHFCSTCNRIRLTSDGKLRLCLQDCFEVDMKPILRGGQTEEKLKELILQAVRMKPLRHQLVEGWKGQERLMSDIGG